MLPIDELCDYYQHDYPVEGDNLSADSVAEDAKQLVAEIKRLQTQPGCLYAGPGRGDCLHFVGLPGESIPDKHDGSDDTVDEYGKPNGWCWVCWKSYQIARLQAIVNRLPKTRDGVPVVPGMTLHQGKRTCEVTNQWVAWLPVEMRQFNLVSNVWYSTREAAEGRTDA